MAAAAYSGIIRPESQLGISLKLHEDSILTIGPIAGGNNASSSPFPLANDRDLVLNQQTHPFPSGKKNVVFPRFYAGWDALVKRLTPEFENLWKSVGVYDLIQLTLLEINPCAAVLEGALNYWSPSCNSLILPMGPVSITLRDVVALTGLPVFGEEVPSRVETDAFRDVKAVPMGTYVQIINTKLDQEVLTSDDHVHFLWLLLSNYVFEPLRGRPTAEVLVIAKALAHGTPLALGTMLLAQTFHRLSLTVGENAFAKPKGGLWLFQLWIFAYFPHLATEMPVESSGNLSIDLHYTSSELSVSSVVRFFRSLVPSSMNELFRFRKVGETHLPTAAISYITALTLGETEWWPIFCATRRLHYGLARHKPSTCSDPGLVLYAPCFWARQLGFFQAIPESIPFKPIVQRYGAKDEEIEAATKDMANDQGPILLSADQPSFNIWWTTIYKQCIPPLDSSGSSGKEVKIEEIKQENAMPSIKGKEKMHPEDEYVLTPVPSYEYNLGGMRTGAPSTINEKAPISNSKPLEVADFLFEEEDPEEDPFLNFGNVNEAQKAKEVPAAGSSLLSFDFGSDIYVTPLQPPARMYLPSSSSLDRLLAPYNSQESRLVRSQLEPVIVKADNPFASLDYSFLTNTAAPSSMPDADALKVARDNLTNFVSSPLASWTSDQIGEAISSFDVLLNACNSASNAELLKTIKGTALFCYQSYVTEQNLANGLSTRAKLNMSELQAYNKKYEALIECEKVDKIRLMNIKADEERLFELEKEMAMLRTRKDEMVRASSEFRDYFPQMEQDLQSEKSRLSDHYADMVKWHSESEQHKRTAAKLCEDWDKYPKRDFNFFP